MPRTAHDIAAMLIHEQHAAGRSIDKMQLQKLLYLVQGAYLAFYGEPAFREPIAAYANGPVVPPVEETYRGQTGGRAPLTHAVGGRPESLPKPVQDIVHSVLRHFGGWAAPALEHYTKRSDSPWRRARGDLPQSAPSNVEIPLTLVGDWFILHGLNPNPERVEHWVPTDEEQRRVESRLDVAKGLGVYSPSISDDERAACERALARMPADEQQD